MRVALITPSYSRDFPLCADLCRSIDTFNVEGLEHVVVVPRRDLALFAPLKSPTRKIIAKEEILPRGLVHVPFPAIVGIPGVYTKRLRTLWLTPNLRPVRGWILQQVVKLSIDRATDADGYVFIDSDIVMVRPFRTETFVKEGRMAFIYMPGVIDHHRERYQRWQDVGCDLLGLPHFPYTGDNYIAAVLCWRRDRLLEMQARMAEVAHTPFQSALLAKRHLSEYHTYGVWCHRGVTGDNGHYEVPRSYTLEDWHYDTSNDAGIQKFVAGLEPHHIAVLMQSTTELPLATRRGIVDALTRDTSH